MDQTTRTSFQSMVGAGFKKIISGNGQITVIGNDNESTSFDVSERTAQAFARDQSRIRTYSIQETFSDSQGLDYLTDISKQIGASKSYSFLEDARRIDAATQSYGTNMQTAFIRDFATNHFGDESPENIRKTIGRLAHMAQGKPQSLNRMIEGFVSGNGYGWGQTNRQVNSAMDSMENRTHDDAILKGAVNHTTNTAGQKSSRVRLDVLSPPDQKGLREPDLTSAIDKADHLRNVDRHEESGHGRIRTTPTGMAKEAIGKIFDGVVDSQGDRPTKEGYFDYSTTTQKVGDAPPVRPIPKNAPSTIGRKR
jgi:conjugal transfer mating pair stabilization protein TraG